jgi:hypothetical protein
VPAGRSTSTWIVTPSRSRTATLVGSITGRRIIGIPALVAADTETLIRTVGPAIHQLLAGD